jgi:hypothetical protein
MVGTVVRYDSGKIMLSQNRLVKGILHFGENKDEVIIYPDPFYAIASRLA